MKYIKLFMARWRIGRARSSGGKTSLDARTSQCGALATRGTLGDGRDDSQGSVAGDSARYELGYDPARITRVERLFSCARISEMSAGRYVSDDLVALTDANGCVVMDDFTSVHSRAGIPQRSC